jgi:hypothetical protein
MSVKPFAIALEYLKFHDSPGLDVPLRALIQVEDFLSVGCELINSKNSSLTKLEICAVNMLYYL